MPAFDSSQGDLILSYRTYGADPNREWVILLPGAGAASAIWRRQIPSLRHSYNLMVIDLPGHGRSPRAAPNASYTFDLIAERIVAAMLNANISSAHFVAMSLGSLIVEAIALREPKRIKSMVLAGGVTGLNLWARTLMFVGNLTGNILPYMWLYRLFAWMIMPGPHHVSTRRLFYAHAKRLSRSEFLRWYRLNREVKLLMDLSATRHVVIPTVLVMGAGDYMFLGSALARARNRKDTKVEVIHSCGHVCSVERPREFNRLVLEFLEAQESLKIRHSRRAP